MTIGEQIQTCRKNLGLSQDELGQKLMVSRQTVSLWENGQTAPTIDNLIRLKEIFGISVDELLGAESKIEAEKMTPAEEYEFSFSPDEIDEIYKLQRAKVYKRPTALLLLIALFIFFCFESDQPDLLIGFAFGVFLADFAVYINVITNFKRAWKISKDNIGSSTYKYRIFDTYFLQAIYKNNEKRREAKCSFTDIQSIQSEGNYLFLSYGGKLYFVSQLFRDSVPSVRHCACACVPKSFKEKGRRRAYFVQRDPAYFVCIRSFMGRRAALYGADDFYHAILSRYPCGARSADSTAVGAACPAGAGA